MGGIEPPSCGTFSINIYVRIRCLRHKRQAFGATWLPPPNASFRNPSAVFPAAKQSSGRTNDYAVTSSLSGHGCLGNHCEPTEVSMNYIVCSCVLDGFLRGQPTNLGTQLTPPLSSRYHFIPVFVFVSVQQKQQLELSIWQITPLGPDSFLLSFQTHCHWGFLRFFSNIVPLLGVCLKLTSFN